MPRVRRGSQSQDREEGRVGRHVAADRRSLHSACRQPRRPDSARRHGHSLSLRRSRRHNQPGGGWLRRRAARGRHVVADPGYPELRHRRHHRRRVAPASTERSGTSRDRARLKWQKKQPPGAWRYSRHLGLGKLQHYYIIQLSQTLHPQR